VPIAIRQALFPGDKEAVLNIWREYVESPSVSLDYQGNEAEFAALPGKYATPQGCILLAIKDDCVVGCIAFRTVNDAICEMKRLYVRPQARGLRLGRLLTEALIVEAKQQGFTEMRLDVLSEFAAAQKLYRELGFIAAEPVSFNPIPGTQFLGLTLS
jgi:putative acetyltransferase